MSAARFCKPESKRSAAAIKRKILSPHNAARIGNRL
jgi:hypothetical protein